MRATAALLTAALLAGCATPRVPMPDADATNAAVAPRVITSPVRHDTDDPAIWVHPDDPARTLVIGTDKETDGALYAWDLQGREVLRVGGLRRPNNVDLARGVVIAGRPTDIVVVTEREAQRLRAFRLPDLAPVDGGGSVLFDGDTVRAPMGVAVYTRPRDGATFVIVGGKTGPAEGYLWQYRVEGKPDGTIGLTFVRALGRFSGRKEIEALAVDHELGYLYASDEQFGVRKYRVDPDAPDADRELAVFGTSGFAADHEGISVYDLGGGRGYILVSNQQADTFRIFPREGTPGNPHDHPLLASVRVSTLDSDGSEVVSRDLPGFPGGLFVAMSTDRTFHYYAMEDILRAAGLPGRP